MGALGEKRGAGRRGLLCGLLLALTAAMPAGEAAAGQQPSGQVAQAEIAFDIPPLSLTDALALFGRQSGMQVSVDAELVRGVSSPGATGSMRPEQALRRLLVGTGITYRMTGANTAMLERVPQQGGDAIQLDPLRVEGTGLGETSEGSGSYTTGEMNTATRLPLSIRETPQSVTVITRQRMDDQAMTDVADAIRYTPGMFVGNGDGTGRPLFYSRGFYVNNVTYDGAPTSFSSFIPTGLANLAMFDRVEVVRGATGLVQGAGNPSAAINLVRKRPTRTLQGDVELSGGSWDTFGGMVDLGGPLNEPGSLRARAVAFRQSTESFRDLEAHDRSLFYGIAEADLGEATTFTLGAYHQKDDTDGGWWGGLPISETGQHLDLPRSTSLANDWEYLDQENNAVFGRLEHRFDNGWALRFDATRSWMDVDGLGTWIYRDLSGGINRQHRAWRGDRETETANYDLFASGPVEVLGRQHELVLGASRIETDQTTRNYGTAYISSNIDVYDWDHAGLEEPGLPYSGTSRSVTTQNSGYATARLNLADPLKLILGGRLDWYDYDDRSGDGDYRVSANLTKYAGLIYDLDAQHSVYGSFTDIFQPQDSLDPGGNTLEPVVGENYEIGIKGEYFGGALNASAALFQIDQKNRASLVEDVSLCTASASCYEASGLVRSRGVDLEIQGALTDNWQIGAGYTYTHTEYVEDASNPKGTPFNTRLPEHLFKLSTMYALPGEFDQWRVGGSLYWQSRIYADGVTEGVTWRNEQDAYALLNLTVGYQATDSLDLQLNVNNVFDTTYYKSIGYSTDWGSAEVYGEPRNVLFTARYRF